MDSKLSNRVVLVTGVRRHRRRVGPRFRQRGCGVVAHYSEHGDQAAALSHELGHSCVPLGADLTLEADLDRLFAEIEAGIGPVEILIANAGVWPPDDVPLHQMTLKQWERRWP